MCVCIYMRTSLHDVNVYCQVSYCKAFLEKRWYFSHIKLSSYLLER